MGPHLAGAKKEEGRRKKERVILHIIINEYRYPNPKRSCVYIPSRPTPVGPQPPYIDVLIGYSGFTSGINGFICTFPVGPPPVCTSSTMNATS
jgi:hypothetical protein